MGTQGDGKRREWVGETSTHLPDERAAPSAGTMADARAVLSETRKAVVLAGTRAVARAVRVGQVKREKR